MVDILWIFLILGIAYLLFSWLPSYFRKRKQRSERQVLDLKFNEDPRESPVESVQRSSILRGMMIVAALLGIAALAFRSIDLVYVIIIWVVPMLIVNNLPRIIQWFKNLGN